MQLDLPTLQHVSDAEGDGQQPDRPPDPFTLAGRQPVLQH